MQKKYVYFTIEQLNNVLRNPVLRERQTLKEGAAARPGKKIQNLSEGQILGLIKCHLVRTALQIIWRNIRTLVMSEWITLCVEQSRLHHVCKYIQSSF